VRTARAISCCSGSEYFSQWRVAVRPLDCFVTTDQRCPDSPAALDPAALENV
jgi:hypothetical protein